MAKFIISGGKKLHGSITVGSAKNSAVAILCASIMIKGKTVLRDVPRIEEVFRILEILKSIGVKIEWRDEHTLSLRADGKLDMAGINRRACEMTRSSLLLLGALAAREKQYKIYKSGGCRLGARTVKPHLFALEKFGVKVESRVKYYEVKNFPLHSSDVVMYESGDTPTENAIMAAVMSSGESVIKFTSSNYMVQDLCYFLVKAGAKIQGIGSTTLKITGVKKLKPVLDYYKSKNLLVEIDGEKKIEEVFSEIVKYLEKKVTK